jgi:SRSO17 transposase
MEAAQVRSWAEELERVVERMGSRFARSEVRERTGDYLRGLLSGVERKNGWQLAEFVGEASPRNVQHFLGRAAWDADAVGEDLRRYVAEHLGADDGVLIVDETGFLKKGTKSVGVGRQYSGTAGRIENCQIGVFVAYRSRHGHALVDRALYLPQAWCEDRPRRRAAGVSEELPFATKPLLARQLLARTLESGLPVRWVTADAVYGGDYQVRRFLEERRLGYVLAVSGLQRLFLSTGYGRVDEHAQSIPQRAWRRLSCGPGAKGERLYDWAYHPLVQDAAEGWTKGLLVRRSVSDPTEMAYYLTHAPTSTTPKRLVEVAGSRWAVEECFAQAKGECGLDHYEVRTWQAWYRHVTLSMFALALLAALRARLLEPTRSRKKRPRARS